MEKHEELEEKSGTSNGELIELESKVYQKNSVLSRIFNRKASKKSPHSEPEKSSLNPLFVEECITKLKYLMEIERVYRDENISFRSLAKKLSIPYYQLSQILNEEIGQNFSDYINDYRIKEAKKILSSPKGAERKNTSVSLDVGFNSMTAYYRAFKKFTGMTPHQYRKKVKKEE